MNISPSPSSILPSLFLAFGSSSTSRSTATCPTAASPASCTAAASSPSPNTTCSACSPLLSRHRWLIHHRRQGLFLRSRTSPCWTAWPEQAFQAVSPDHAYRVAHEILVGPGWDDVTELVRLTFHRPAGDPSAEWVHGE